MKKYILLFAFLASFVFQSCVTSRGLAKKANKMEQAGQYEMASNLYYKAVVKDKTNPTALQGMKRVGNKILGKYLSSFSENKLKKNYKTAVYDYLNAKEYQKKISKINVNLEISSFYQEDYQIVREQYLAQEYEKGVGLISKENFSEAERCFNEIYRFDKNYKDVATLRNTAYLEPLYRKAEAAKKIRKYRNAYSYYQKILNRTIDYKKTKSHLQYILQKGRIPITILSKNRGRYSTTTESLKQFVINKMIKKQDPFIKIVDRENIDNIVKEQELAMSGMVNEKEQVEVGEISGVKYSIIINVTAYDEDYKAPKAKSLKGFEEYTEKYKEEGTIKYRTKYKPVTYYLYKGYRKINITTSYKIISVKTGEIIASNIVSKSNSSEVEYATYSGNKKKLYPSIDNKPATERKMKNALQEWLNADRTLADKTTLSTHLQANIANKITDEIFNILYTK